jgi:hypothetical protein
VKENQDKHFLKYMDKPYEMQGLHHEDLGWSKNEPLLLYFNPFQRVDFNLVQYFIANKFSIKEHKIYNGKYTHYTEIFPLEAKTGITNIFYIHS